MVQNRMAAHQELPAFARMIEERAAVRSVRCQGATVYCASPISTGVWLQRDAIRSGGRHRAHRHRSKSPIQQAIWGVMQASCALANYPFVAGEFLGYGVCLPGIRAVLPGERRSKRCRRSAGRGWILVLRNEIPRYSFGDHCQYVVDERQGWLRHHRDSLLRWRESSSRIARNP